MCIPAVLYLIYRSIAPYEDGMKDPKLGGALFYPSIFGFALGIAHLLMDFNLVFGGFGVLAFMLLYPVIETYAVVVIFNRTFFLKQPGAALYFGIGGGALAFGLAFVEIFRTALIDRAAQLGELGLIGTMVAVATAYVLLHSAKGLLLGTYFTEGSRVRGVIVAAGLQIPFGALQLTFWLGISQAEMASAMLVYGALFYFLVWHVFFPKHLPDELEAEIKRVQKRARRRAIARRQK